MRTELNSVPSLYSLQDSFETSLSEVATLPNSLLREPASLKWGSLPGTPKGMTNAEPSHRLLFFPWRKQISQCCEAGAFQAVAWQRTTKHSPLVPSSEVANLLVPQLSQADSLKTAAPHNSRGGSVGKTIFREHQAEAGAFHVVCSML